MAFRTNKMPVLQEKTASGSVASFNTILQKPLVNGEFTIQAYQEGSGDPSPDNVRNIVGFNAINITHSDGVNTPVIYTKSLGETVYDGSYNSVSGKKIITRIYAKLPKINYKSSVSGVFLTPLIPDLPRGIFNKLIITNCDIFKAVSTPNSASDLPDLSISAALNTFRVQIRDISSDSLTIEQFNNKYPNIYVVHELAEPIESNIGATEIQIFNGANNIFCDTGNTSLVFNDLDLAKRGSFREVFKLP